MSDPQPLIAARRARAEQAHNKAHAALAAMVRVREPITFAAVAARAGVSREFLYRHPELAAKIRTARNTTPLTAASDSAEENRPVLAALREHIRRLEADHATQVQALRAENAQLRRQLESALGELLATSARQPARPNM